MNPIRRVLGMFAANMPVTLAIGLVGLGLVVLGIWARRSRRKRGSALLAIVLGSGLVLFSGVVVVSNRHLLQRLFAQDFDDPAKIEKLKEADLVPAAADGILPGAWPQWRGPRRDGHSPEHGLLPNWPEEGPPRLWRRSLGSGYSSLAVVAGRVFAQDLQGSNERVLCFDDATGIPRWSFTYPVDYSGLQSGYANGPRATPTVFRDRVYTVGATGVFLCLEASPQNGQASVLWRHDLLQEFDASLPQWGVACSPLIEGNLVVVQPGGEKGSVAAFEADSGKLVWTALSDPSGYSSPVAATIGGVRQIICITGKGLAGLRAANGERLWYFPWPTPFNGNIATPIVAGRMVFISSSYESGCALLEINEAGGSFSVDPVYVKRNKLMRNHHSTCVLVGNHLYGFDDAILRCLDIRTGQEAWYSRDPGKGCLLAADGKLFILNQDGVLTMAEANPQEYRRLGRINLFQDSKETWALPVLADGRLFVRSDRELICLDLRPLEP